MLLEGVLEHGLLLPTIAYALGIRDNGEAGLEERIARALEGTQVLIVLDNFEQIVDAAPELVRLYAVAPLASFLVTSRVVLRIRGEQVYEVETLRLPAGTGPAGVERARRCTAVAAVRRPRAGGQAGLRAHRRERGASRGHLPTARRPAAGDRAGRREGPPAHPAEHRCSAWSNSLPLLTAPVARPSRAAPDDAGHDRLERRPAARRAARDCSRISACSRPVSPSRPSRRSVRGRVVGRVGPGRLSRPRGRVARQAGGARRAVDVLAARDHARVRDRAPQGARRG